MKYETPEHVSAADRVARELEKIWQCRISNSLGAHSAFNRLIFEDNFPTAWLEIKCRSNAFNKYSTYMISVHKVDAAKIWKNLTGMPVYLAVEFSDALGVIDLLETKYAVAAGGRFDRGNPKDHEPCAYFDIKDFDLVRCHAAA